MEVTLSLTPEQWETVKAAVPEGVGYRIKRGGRNQVGYTADFEKFWSHYPRKDAKPEAFGCWNARITQKVATAEELILAAKRYGEECVRDGTEQKYIKLPATFLGTNERWRPYLTKEIQFEGNARHYRP
jgi:hypothetical protein